MICNNCGTHLSDSVRYCNSCGSSVEPAGTTTHASSPNPVYVSSLFADPPPQPALPSVVCTLHSNVVASGVCVGCGNFYCRPCLVAHDGRNVCRNCSIRVNTAPAPNPQQYQYPQSPQSYQTVQPQQHPYQHPYQQPPAPYYQQGYAPQVVLYAKRKEPGLALFLSFFFPGLGQIYNGDVGKGIALMIGFWLLVWVFIGWIFWIWSMVDAYRTANDINMGRRV